MAVNKSATAVFATVGGIVLLFAYRASTEAAPPVALPAASAPRSAAASVTPTPTPTPSSTPTLSASPTPTPSPTTAPSTTPTPARRAPSPSPTPKPTPKPTPSRPPSPTPKPRPTPAAPPPPPTGLKAGTYTGAVENTPYGPVQVQVSIAGGKVAAATAIAHPNSPGTSQAINAYAVPRLQGESVGTTDGRIAMVSGATYTSDGYVGSLQSAIDQAKP
ncbi:MAG: FMN-binding protein [Promicromonosporaceae bacterium]|nr:FMN-binding protein [Promicromonosporaceae bacterium]